MESVVPVVVAAQQIAHPLLLLRRDIEVLLALAFNGLLLLFLTTEASAPTGVDLALVNPMLVF